MLDMKDINSTDAQILGKQIRAMRLRENLTQADLAIKAGTSRLTIIDLEAGGNVGMHVFSKVLKILGGNITATHAAPHTQTKRIRVINKKIDAAQYPQLNLVTWDRSVKIIPEKDAFAIYEKNKRFLDLDNADRKEISLINRLTEKYGNGVML